MRPLALLALLAGVLAGCDGAFSPYTAAGASFALYGTLDADVDSQVVRIEPLRQRPDDPPGTAFTLRSEGPDGVVEWSVRLGSDASGRPIHFGEARVTLRPGEAHRLIATGADGGTTTARVDVPDALPLEAGEVTVNADTSVVRQLLRLQGGGGQPASVEVVYVVRSAAEAPPVTVARAYATQPDGTTRSVLLALQADVERARVLAGVPRGRPLLLDTTFVRYRLGRPAVVEDGFGAVRVEATLASGWALPDSLLPYLRLERPAP